jgi:hypothetical protein
MVGFLVFIYAVQLAASMIMSIGAVVTVGTMV